MPWAKGLLHAQVVMQGGGEWVDRERCVPTALQRGCKSVLAPDCSHLLGELPCSVSLLETASGRMS